MPKQMYVNVVNEEESRIAVVRDGLLEELSIETAGDEHIEGNVYKARIERILPGLDAVFVDFGRAKNGFLSMGEIHPDYFGGQDKRIENLKKGLELIVQVKKAEIGEKGAALTTYVSIPGRYIVLMPFVEKRGVSRQINDNSERRELKTLVELANFPDDMGYIIRTAAGDRTKQEVQRDANYLLRLWKKILTQSEAVDAPALLYRNSDVVIRTIRDYFTPDITEVLVDEPKAFEKVSGFFASLMPWHAKKVKYYDAKAPLFTKHNLEDQINATHEDKVKLPSGGSIVIEQTEALVSIDVNSGGGAKSKDVEETVLTTNMEAAFEIARQLRLRDMGGLIVIDFIDMRSTANKTKVKKELAKNLKNDKARTDMGTMSKFGLVELSRQRIKGASSAKQTSSCPYCQGAGRVKNVENFTLSVLRLIQAVLARNPNVQRVAVGLSIPASTYMLNRKRANLDKLEKTFSTSVDVFAEPELLPNSYYIEFELPEKTRVESNLPTEIAPERLRLKMPFPKPEPVADFTGLTYSAIEEGEEAEEPLEPEVELEASEPAEAPQTPQTGDQPEQGFKKKRRRRRRRGKSNGERPTEAGVEQGQPTAPTEKEAEPAPEQQPVLQEAQSSQQPGQKSGRRKRSRRGGKKQAQGQQPAIQAAEQKPEAQPAPQQAPQQANQGAEGEAPKPEKTGRRRNRGRKRSRGRGQGAGQDALVVVQESKPAEAPKVQEPPAPQQPKAEQPKAAAKPKPAPKPKAATPKAEPKVAVEAPKKVAKPRVRKPKAEAPPEASAKPEKAAEKKPAKSKAAKTAPADGVAAKAAPRKSAPRKKKAEEPQA